MQQNTNRATTIGPVNTNNTSDERNWNLIAFRGSILLMFVLCCYCNIADMVYYCLLVQLYATFHDCDFVKFEVAVIISNFVMTVLMIVGIFIVIKHHICELRTYLPFLFAFSWLQLMLILVLILLYPLVHVIHNKWKKEETLAEYEKEFECCGVFGPDDYLLKFGKLPRSCFRNGVMEARNLRFEGCLTRDNMTTSLIRMEMITPFCHLVLIILLILFYYYAKSKRIRVRTFRDLWSSYIIL